MKAIPARIGDIEAEELIMKATVGDRLIVEGTYGGNPRREGFIVGVEHADGTPP